MKELPPLKRRAGSMMRLPGRRRYRAPSTQGSLILSTPTRVDWPFGCRRKTVRKLALRGTALGSTCWTFKRRERLRALGVSSICFETRYDLPCLG